MNERQMSQYPVQKVTYPLELESADTAALQAEIVNFLQEKLGNRAYVCILGYQVKSAGQDVFRQMTIGLENPVSMWPTLFCLKTVGKRLEEINNAISAPMQQITKDNNPLIIQERSEPPQKKE